MKPFFVQQEVPTGRIADLLCNALEGGSNYWYLIEKTVEPKRWVREEKPTFKTKEEAEKNTNFHYFHWYPLNPGGALIISDRSGEGDESARYRLDEDAIANGLQIFAKIVPHHFSDFLREQDDAITADAFLQCCVFGDIIYG